MDIPTGLSNRSGTNRRNNNPRSILQGAPNSKEHSHTTSNTTSTRRSNRQPTSKAASRRRSHNKSVHTRTSCNFRYISLVRQTSPTRVRGHRNGHANNHTRVTKVSTSRTRTNPRPPQVITRYTIRHHANSPHNTLHLVQLQRHPYRNVTHNHFPP